MKKLFLAALGIVCLGLALATAQTVNRSIQLSLDPTGQIVVSTPGGVFFPDRVHGNSSRTPSVASNGSGTVLTGTDIAGEIVEGTGSITSSIVTFSRVQNATPYCTAVSNAVATPVALTSVSPAGFNAAHSANTQSAQATVLRIFYNCWSARIQ